MLIQNERTHRCTGTGRFFLDERIVAFEKRGQWLELIFIFLTLILEILVLAILLVLLIAAVDSLLPRLIVLLVLLIVELLIVLILLIVELLIVLVLLRHSFHLPSRTTDAAGTPGCSLKNVHP